MGVKHKRALWLVLMIAAAFALTAASAAPTQSFDDFLADCGMDPSDPAVSSHVTRIGQSVRVLDVELCMEGLYYDGQRLLIGWKTDNLRPEQPALVLYTNVRLGGISVDADADFPISQWWPRVFGLFVTGDPINGLMGGFDSANAKDFLLQSTQDVSVSFTVKRPRRPITVVDADIRNPYQDAAAETDRQSMLAAMEACCVTIAPEGDMDVQAWQDKGYLVVNRGGELLNADGTTDDMTLLNGEDLTDADEADVTFTFTVDFDALSGE